MTRSTRGRNHRREREAPLSEQTGEASAVFMSCRRQIISPTRLCGAWLALALTAASNGGWAATALPECRETRAPAPRVVASSLVHGGGRAGRAVALLGRKKLARARESEPVACIGVNPAGLSTAEKELIALRKAAARPIDVSMHATSGGGAKIKAPASGRAPACR